MNSKLINLGVGLTGIVLGIGGTLLYLYGINIPPIGLRIKPNQVICQNPVFQLEVLKIDINGQDFTPPSQYYSLASEEQVNSKEIEIVTKHQNKETFLTFRRIKTCSL